LLLISNFRGTTHESQADTPHLIGYWLNWKLKKLPPVVASRINNHLILDFLQKHIGIYSLLYGCVAEV